VRLVSCAVDTAFGDPDHWRRGPRVAAAVLSSGFVGFARRAALEGERSGDPDGVTRAAEGSRPRCEEPHGRRNRCDDCAHRECECAVLMTFQGLVLVSGKRDCRTFRERSFPSPLTQTGRGGAWSSSRRDG
jgi:hypothetical protein